MLCLFKSHYSIGKSILNFSDNSDQSILSICKDLKLKKIFLIEDPLKFFLEHISLYVKKESKLDRFL